LVFLARQCPLGTRVALVIGLCHSHFSYFCFDYTMWRRGDRNRTSSVPVARQSATSSVILLCLPLMVSSTTSTGGLAVVTPGSPRLVVAPVLGVSGVGGVSQGATGIGVTRSAALGDVFPTPESSSATGLRVSVLYLSRSPIFLSRPLTRGRWGTKQSLRDHRSPLWRGCCMRCRPRLTGTSCV
jgi:hypothetical protein